MSGALDQFRLEVSHSTQRTRPGWSDRSIKGRQRSHASASRHSPSDSSSQTPTTWTRPATAT